MTGQIVQFLGLCYNLDMTTGALIIPTGVGASIGGYAGDAGAYIRKLAKDCRLIINPNAVNAACFSSITENMLYVEGYSLDEFFKGNINLVPKIGNKIGIVFDKSISENVLNVHINTANAVKVVYGIDIIGYEITEEPVGVEFYIDKSGSSMGDVRNLSTIKNAAEKLISKGAEAIAIVCSFPEEDSDDYANGIGADPVGGVEAIISHYISKELKIPCAHAPAFENITIPTEIVSPKSAAEYITPTFLPCILIGLNQGAKIVNSSEAKAEEEISVNDIDFLVTPYDCLGGIGVLEMLKKNKKVYAIKENKTVLDVTNEKLNIKCDIIDTYNDLRELI